MGMPVVDALQTLSFSARHSHRVSDHRNSEAAESWQVTVGDGRADHKVLFAEAIWSKRLQAVKPHWWKTPTFWLNLILLLVPIIGPDLRDPVPPPSAQKNEAQGGRGIAAAAPPPKFWRSRLRELTGPGELTPEQLRFTWRFGTLVLFVFGIAALTTAFSRFLAYSWAVWTTVVISPIVVIAILVFMNGPRNLASHVMVAATDETGTDSLLQCIRERLEFLESQCAKVVIVAHSQGGFLTHRLLTQDGDGKHQSTVRFVGIASGLKPITMLNDNNNPRTAAGSWLCLIGGCCLAASIWPLLGAFQMATAPLYQAIVNLITPILVLPPVDLGPIFRDTEYSEINPWALLDAVIDSLHWSTAILFVAAFATVSAGHYLLKNNYTKAIAQPSNRPGFRWSEYSSPHDIVGRMMFPSLPNGVSRPPVASPGHALLDHLTSTYLGKTATLPLELANQLLTDLGIVKDAKLRKRRVEAVEFSSAAIGQRLQNLRGSIVGGLASAVIVLPVLLLGVAQATVLKQSWLVLLTVSSLLQLFVAFRFNLYRKRFFRLISRNVDLRTVPPLLQSSVEARRVLVASTLTGGVVCTWSGALGFRLGAMNPLVSQLLGGSSLLFLVGLVMLGSVPGLLAGYLPRPMLYGGYLGVLLVVLVRNSVGAVALGLPWWVVSQVVAVIFGIAGSGAGFRALVKARSTALDISPSTASRAP